MFVLAMAMAYGLEEQDAMDSGGDSDQTAPELSAAKPVFFVQNRVFTSLTTQDVYRGVGLVIDAENIKGIQRVGNLWRIYPSTTEERVDLLTNGIGLKGTHITLVDINPFRPKFDGTKVTVHGIPLSASDTVISAALRAQGCSLTSPIERQLLRIDGKLTSCQTGGRSVFLELPDGKHLPRHLEMGRYRSSVYYRNQPLHVGRFNPDVTCKKCLLQGHFANSCPNDWVCTACRRPGHRRGQCPLDDKSTVNSDDDASRHAEADDSSSEHGDEDEPTGSQHGSGQKDASVSQSHGTTPANKATPRRKIKAKTKKKKKQDLTANIADEAKITKFLSAVRHRDAANSTVSDSEVAAATQQGKASKPVRSPKTPPEDQNDAAKRSKSGESNG